MIKVFALSEVLILYSPAVEGFDPEKIGIEVNLVSKEAEIFVQQYPKSTQNCLGEFFLFTIQYLIQKTTSTMTKLQHPNVIK